MSMGPSTKRHFHEELDELQELLLTMAGKTEQAVAQAVKAVADADTTLAAVLREGDEVIDELETQVDERVQHLLALHQPMASDLRLILTVLKVANDLERVADHAVNIARAVRRMRKTSPPPRLRELAEMGEIGREMLADSLAAFVARDPASARRVRRTDDKVDSLRKSLFRIMVTHMLEDPRHIGGGLEVLLISQNLERIADLSTNIAEDVVFLVEGRAGMRSLKSWDESDREAAEGD